MLSNEVPRNRLFVVFVLLALFLILSLGNTTTKVDKDKSEKNMLNILY